MTHFFSVLGIWLGALFTFAIFSFLYKDNPFYKIAEQIFVGLSAGYWFVYTIFFILMPNLFNPLLQDFAVNWIKLIPAVLGILMLLRLIPSIDWVSRFPIALVIGTTSGIFFLRYLKSDVINQLTATIMNPFHGANWVNVVGQILLIVGTLSGVIYFYFSKKHEGAFGVTAKIGIYFLMVSFGAAFGYTAMARISLLIGRLQFLLGDWLGIINP
ncbi:MAG: hypothetical protein ISS80_06085 [Candidatus Cloacimonetes bacterium]|nr:hypothetical protein [Candidatus Cloacimonadota bacterium]MBL7149625.1 hypothetical protein [Candidatus Cloacimonadota bacterium]